jgi:hypothetical protein
MCDTEVQPASRTLDTPIGTIYPVPLESARSPLLLQGELGIPPNKTWLPVFHFDLECHCRSPADIPDAPRIYPGHLDSSRDATRVVVWQPDASRVELIEYDGESARLDTVPTVPTLSVALRP